MSQVELAKHKQMAGIGHNGGPPLEQLAKIYADVPEIQTIPEWCQAQGVARSFWYKLADRPETIRIGGCVRITRLGHLKWLQRKLAETDAA